MDRHGSACGSRSIVDSELIDRSADGDRGSFGIDDATRQFRQLVLTHAAASREEARRLQDRAREVLRACASNSSQ